MVKRIIGNPDGTTFSDFSLLTGYTGLDCTPDKINLNTDLGGLVLGIPFLSAAMGSVTGQELADKLGRMGGIGVLPTSMGIEKQCRIIQEIKNQEIGFVEEPITEREYCSIEDVVNAARTLGHSRIPIVDRNNKFLGLFLMQRFLESSVDVRKNITDIMLKPDDGEIPYIIAPNLTAVEAGKEIRERGVEYLVVLDEQHRLRKMAFKKDFEQIKVGAAISTHPGWQESIEALAPSGVDMIVIDTSDGYSVFVEDVLEGYLFMKKSRGWNIQICAGNIITFEGAYFLMEKRADIVKVGMSSGSTCKSHGQKGVGRAPIPALIDADRAKQKYLSDTGRYVGLIMDGGLITMADVVIALTMADAAMMGNYFNRFYEAAAEKYDEYGKPTTVESMMRHVSTWGEGSERAMNLNRYGHTSRKTFFPQGVEGYVNYAGRLKPVLKEDLIKIKDAMSNAGCRNLKELRENAVIERMSDAAKGIVHDHHNIIVTDNKSRMGYLP